MDDVVVRIENLSKVFKIDQHRDLKAVNNVSGEIRRGEVLGIVGESGCGKSTLAQLILGLIAPSAGSVSFDLPASRGSNQAGGRGFAGAVSAIFQNPLRALDPRFSIRRSLAENITSASKDRVEGGTVDADGLVRHWLARVGLDPWVADRFPHQLSGGQRQRACIARALIGGPELVVLDEAVSALDLSIQAQILALLRELQDELRLTMVFISHDLGVIRSLADRIWVMYLGKVVEAAPGEELFTASAHPYTELLMRSVPTREALTEFSGEEDAAREDVSALSLPGGCAFWPRCPFATDVCRNLVPELLHLGGSDRRLAACHHPLVVPIGIQS
jgi:oligopeptide/dipeptide ABC transporter ATP-binding protein